MNSQPANSDFALKVERLYSQLTAYARADPATARESGFPLGGKLFFAGELSNQSRARVVAAAIAGAASLAASADAAALRGAMREGAIDFVVNSLDEALRILKNEIRKRQPVAVGVTLPPASVEREMQERGVVPDLTESDVARRAEGEEPVGALLVWSVASGGTLWLPRLDALAAACLEPDEAAALRWLRLAPRYLGRMAQGVRLVRCREKSAARFLEELRLGTESCEIAVETEVRQETGGQVSVHRLVPAG
jgi:hypothetical protein